jgi:hypothetical protein
MRTTRSMKLYLAVAGLMLALVVGGCATMAPKAERYAAAPLGSTFTWTRTNSGSFGSGTTQYTTKVNERMWEGKRVTAFVGYQGMTLLCTAEGTWPAVLGVDGKPIISWDPPIGYDWPLEVGKTWTKSYRLTIHPRNQTIPFDITTKVEAYENVTVPAGTFKVFKVSDSDTIGQESVMWFSQELGLFVKHTQKRSANCPFGPGTSDEELVSYTLAK